MFGGFLKQDKSVMNLLTLSRRDEPDELLTLLTLFYRNQIYEENRGKWTVAPEPEVRLLPPKGAVFSFSFSFSG